jgi:hypothetical protein
MFEAQLNSRAAEPRLLAVRCIKTARWHFISFLSDSLIAWFID